jgi:hypothetical protein
MSEALSSSLSQRDVQRMHHDVKHTQHRSHPPAMRLPRGARGFDEDEEEDVLFPSGGVSPPAAAPAAGAASARASETTTSDIVADVVAAIDALPDGALYANTTPRQRERIRRDTCQSNAVLQRTMHANPASSATTLSLLALGGGVLVGSMLASTTARADFRGVASPVSKRAVERMLHYA